MSFTTSKIPPTARYIAVIVAITILVFVVFIGASMFPRETPNVTKNYGATLNVGEYTVSVSEAKYDTATGEIRITLYHMKAEPDMPENNYFLQVYQNKDRNKALSYSPESQDKQNTVLILTGAKPNWTSISVDILTNSYDGKPETATVTIDKRDMTEYDSRQIVYVYVTPTPGADENE